MKANPGRPVSRGVRRAFLVVAVVGLLSVPVLAGPPAQSGEIDPDDVVFELQRLGGGLGLGELRFGLADVDGDADDFVVAVLLFEQWDADGRVEPAREGERDAFRF